MQETSSKEFNPALPRTEVGGIPREWPYVFDAFWQYSCRQVSRGNRSRLFSPGQCSAARWLAGYAAACGSCTRRRTTRNARRIFSSGPRCEESLHQRSCGTESDRQSGSESDSDSTSESESETERKRESEREIKKRERERALERKRGQEQREERKRRSEREGEGGRGGKDACVMETENLCERVKACGSHHLPHPHVSCMHAFNESAWILVSLLRAYMCTTR